MPDRIHWGTAEFSGTGLKPYIFDSQFDIPRRSNADIDGFLVLTEEKIAARKLYRLISVPRIHRGGESFVSLLQDEVPGISRPDHIIPLLEFE